VNESIQKKHEKSYLNNIRKEHFFAAFKKDINSNAKGGGGAGRTLSYAPCGRYPTFFCYPRGIACRDERLRSCRRNLPQNSAYRTAL
jgi:hypothetical protein